MQSLSRKARQMVSANAKNKERRRVLAILDYYRNLDPGGSIEHVLALIRNKVASGEEITPA